MIERLRGDIGIFGEHNESPGREFLVDTPAKVHSNEIASLITMLEGDQEAQFNVMNLPRVHREKLKALKFIADERYNRYLALGMTQEELEDLKIDFNEEDLLEMIG